MAEWATISADVCTEEQKLDNKKLYFEIKENVLQKADHTRELSNQELKDCIEGELQKRDKEGLLSFEKRRQYAERLFASFRKFGVLQELIEDEEVTEILVNGPTHIFYEKAGELHCFEKSYGT